MKSFAEAFVLDARKEKWTNLLCERPGSIAMQASKLFNYLDNNLIEQNDLLKNVAAYDAEGVFYNFNQQPKSISFEQAIKEGKDHDAIFSINPGELAVCFLHDGCNFVCKR